MRPVIIVQSCRVDAETVVRECVECVVIRRYNQTGLLCSLKGYREIWINSCPFGWMIIHCNQTERERERDAIKPVPSSVGQFGDPPKSIRKDKLEFLLSLVECRLTKSTTPTIVKNSAKVFRVASLHFAAIQAKPTRWLPGRVVSRCLSWV